MELIFFILIILMFLASFLVYFGKGDFLIAGVNMMPKEDREKLDMEYIRKKLGNMSFIISAGMLLLFLENFYYNNNILLIIALGLIITPTIILVKITFTNSWS